MKPVTQISNRDPENDRTTLEDVLIDILMLGSDRGALVCPAQDGREPVVTVLMCSGEALRRIGPKLLPILSGMGDPAVENLGEFSEKTRLLEFFQVTAKAPTGWIWFELPFGRVQVTGCSVYGTAVCEQVAAICSANGAPCSLNGKAAPGYVIEKEVKR